MKKINYILFNFILFLILFLPKSGVTLSSSHTIDDVESIPGTHITWQQVYEK